MRDYKVYLPHHREIEQLERQRKRYERFVALASAALSVLALVILVAGICWSCVDATVRTAELQERYYSKPVATTYARPAAYRLASPTADEMDQVDHLMALQQVRR